jgi:hypothetical protein
MAHTAHTPKPVAWRHGLIHPPRGHDRIRRDCTVQEARLAAVFACNTTQFADTFTQFAASSAGEGAAALCRLAMSDSRLTPAGRARS